MTDTTSITYLAPLAQSIILLIGIFLTYRWNMKMLTSTDKPYINFQFIKFSSDDIITIYRENVGKGTLTGIFFKVNGKPYKSTIPLKVGERSSTEPIHVTKDQLDKGINITSIYCIDIHKQKHKQESVYRDSTQINFRNTELL